MDIVGKSINLPPTTVEGGVAAAPPIRWIRARPPLRYRILRLHVVDLRPSVRVAVNAHGRRERAHRIRRSNRHGRRCLRRRVESLVRGAINTVPWLLVPT